VDHEVNAVTRVFIEVLKVKNYLELGVSQMLITEASFVEDGGSKTDLEEEPDGK